MTEILDESAVSEIEAKMLTGHYPDLDQVRALCATVKHLREAAGKALATLESERIRLCGYCKQGHAFDVKQNAHVWRKLGDKFDGATLGCEAAHLHSTITTLRQAMKSQYQGA